MRDATGHAGQDRVGETPPVRATYALTADDYAGAARLHLRGQWLRRPVAAGVLVAFWIAGTAQAVLTWEDAQGPPAGLILSLAVLPLGAIVTALAAPMQARRHYGQNRLLRLVATLEADSSALRIAAETATSDVPWHDVLRWRENAALVLLYTAERLYLVVPKRALPPGAVEALRGWQAAGSAERRSEPRRAEARGLAALFADDAAAGTRPAAEGRDPPLASSATWIISRADLVAAQRLYYRWHWRRPRTLLMPLLVAVGAGAASTAVGLGFDAKAALGAGAAILALRLAVYAALPLILRDFRRKQPDLAYPWRVELDRVGVRAVMPHRDGRIAWSDYVAFAQDAQVILLYQSDLLFQIIPVHAVDAAFLETFRELRGALPRR